MDMNFELMVDNASESELREIYAALSVEFAFENDFTPLAEFLMPQSVFSVYDTVNWDGYYNFLARLSKRYPNVYFSIYCDDNCGSVREASQWVSYFKGGDSRTFDAEIVYEPNPFLEANSQG